MSAQEACEQMRPQFIAPIPHDDEGMRPMVLCAATAAERSRQTGVERTVVGDKARRFVLAGMLGLPEGRAEAAGRPGHRYPEAMAGSIVDVKQLSPPIHWRALARMVQRTCGDKTQHHTRTRCLEPYDTPRQRARGLTPFAAFAEASQARWTGGRMA